MQQIMDRFFDVQQNIENLKKRKAAKKRRERKGKK